MEFFHLDTHMYTVSTHTCKQYLSMYMYILTFICSCMQDMGQYHKWSGTISGTWGTFFFLFLDQILATLALIPVPRPCFNLPLVLPFPYPCNELTSDGGSLGPSTQKSMMLSANKSTSHDIATKDD